MKTKKTLQLDPSSVHVQLGLCAAALAGTAAAVPQANAAIVTFNTPIVMPATFSGVYVDLGTGVSSTTGSFPGWDFNPYLVTATGALGFYWDQTPAGVDGGVAGGATGPYLSLSPGAVVGPGSTYTAAIQGTTGSPYLTTGTHILGFRFFNDVSGLTDYGYLTMSNTAISGPSSGLPGVNSTTNKGTPPIGRTPATPPGYPATIMSWSYDDTGAAITVVPEPSTVALLTISALAAGALGLRKWRRQRAA